MSKSNYQSFVDRINNLSTTDDIKRCYLSLDRLYTAGIFTVSEFRRLDDKLLHKQITLEEVAECNKHY